VELDRLATGRIDKHAHAVFLKHCVFVAVNVDRSPPAMSAIKSEWRHLRHVYAKPGQLALGQLGVKFAPQTVIIGTDGSLVAQRAPGVNGRLRGREIGDLLLSLVVPGGGAGVRTDAPAEKGRRHRSAQRRQEKPA